MKKAVSWVFIVACFVACLIPSLGMVVNPTEEPVGNERMLPFPSLFSEDGQFNAAFLSDLGEYFEQHFAFRPEAITADAAIQGGLFGVSNVDSVVMGKDGWLYYASTLDDYMGRNTLTRQQIDGIVHNLGLVQERVEEGDARFLFTVAPNKSTLYPQSMPGYYHADATADRNRTLLNAALEGASVGYCNLFAAFEEQDEVLYFARDSHWNNKGALLAYDAILAALGKPHDDFSGASVEVRRDFMGDLSAMVYPAGAEPEVNYYYGAEDRFSYVTDTTSVEESFIRTENPDAEGTLFMYRDSFGNLLLPFFASAFNEAVFSKGFPIMLDMAIDQYQPDDVVFVIAERNIDWFLTRPPIMAAPVRQAEAFDLTAMATEVPLTVRTSPNSPLYLEVTGPVNEAWGSGSGSICLYVRDDEGGGTLYECYNRLTDQREDAFLAYFDASLFEGVSTLSVTVGVLDTTGFTAVGSCTAPIERE